MTIHFASARNTPATPFARVLIERRPLNAANDNSAAHAGGPFLEEALRHFSRHGFGAAREARAEAEAAYFSGDRIGYDHWLGICRTLDRHLALCVARSVEHMDGTAF